PPRERHRGQRGDGGWETEGGPRRRPIRGEHPWEPAATVSAFYLVGIDDGDRGGNPTRLRVFRSPRPRRGPARTPPRLASRLDLRRIPSVRRRADRGDLDPRNRGGSPRRLRDLRSDLFPADRVGDGRPTADLPVSPLSTHRGPVRDESNVACHALARRLRVLGP